LLQVAYKFISQLLDGNDSFMQCGEVFAFNHGCRCT